jgi:potassium voltage-gated channel Shaw-related subfamily C protein
VSALSVFFITISIMSFCIRTNQELRTQLLGNVTDTRQDGKLYWQLVSTEDVPHIMFEYMENVCNVWFTFELAIRFLVSPKKLKFFKIVANVIDVISTMSFYLDTLMNKLEIDQEVLEFLYIIRIMRLYKLTKHSTGLRILLKSFSASAKELFLLIFLIVLGIVIFASLMFFAELTEYNPDNHFDSIPNGVYWAVVTITSVGPGDMVPNTRAGMVVGSLCALSGVIVLALPAPIIVANFTLFYSHTQVTYKRI